MKILPKNQSVGKNINFDKKKKKNCVQEIYHLVKNSNFAKKIKTLASKSVIFI